MRKLIVTILLLAFLISTPTYAGDKLSAYERVIKTGTIKCGYALSPPNLMMDPNTKQLSGVDYDLWEAIGKELDLKIEWAEESGWGNYIEGLRTDRFDVFCSQAWPNPARTKFLTSAGPIIYTFLNAYVRMDDHRFDGNIEDINSPDISISAIDGDVSVDMAKSRFPKSKIYTLPQMASVSDMYQAIISKKSDVIFLDKNFYKYLTKNNEGTLREVSDVPSSHTYSSYYGMKSGEFKLRDMINITLQNFIDNGRLEKITKKYSEHYTVRDKGFKSKTEQASE